MIGKQQYAQMSVAEQKKYDGYKDHVEGLNENLPSTKLGLEARLKAHKEKRLKTYRDANPKKK